MMSRGFRYRYLTPRLKLYLHKAFEPVVTHHPMCATPINYTQDSL